MTGHNAIPPLVRIEVLTRDGGCLGPRFGATDPCAGALQLDHIRDQPHVGDPIVKRGAKRRHSYKPASEPRFLAVFCAHLDGFATSHRAELREYLASFQREDQAA